MGNGEHSPLVCGNLTAAQKSTIEAALAANAPKEHVKMAFDKTRAATLATAIRANNVDTLKLDPPAGAPTNADFEARQAASAKAIDTLHATLTSDQRKALVAAIQSHEASVRNGGERGDHGKTSRRRFARSSRLTSRRRKTWLR